MSANPITIKYRPSPIDRVVFAILGVLNLVGGTYTALAYGDLAATTLLFDNNISARVFGALLALDGLVLIVLAIWSYRIRWHIGILTTALFVGFLTRLYTFVGMAMVHDHIKAGYYFSSIAIVVLFAAYWLWVKLNGRPIQ